jgi:peptide/nickel transport system permease protein
VRYLLRKLGFYLVALWAALTVNFFVPRLMPGDPVEILISKLGQHGPVTPEMRASIEALLGTNSGEPLWNQYLDYLGNLAHGDLGVSVTFFPASVGSIIEQTLPWTIGLIGLATVISFLVGVGLGTVAGWKRGSWLDNLIPVTTMFQSVKLAAERFPAEPSVVTVPDIVKPDPRSRVLRA